MITLEFSASNIRSILQKLFPERRLVLSQFTFFNQCGVATPTGQTYRRGRRCYQIYDILPIAAVLALKEEGIPLCKIKNAPQMIQTRARRIFELGEGCLLSGFGEVVTLSLKGEEVSQDAISALIEADSPLLFWSFDVGMLAKRIEAAATGVDLSDGSTDSAQPANTPVRMPLLKVA